MSTKHSKNISRFEKCISFHVYYIILSENYLIRLRDNIKYSLTKYKDFLNLLVIYRIT